MELDRNKEGKFKIARRTFTLEFKAEVVRHEKAGSLSWAETGRKFDANLRLLNHGMHMDGKALKPAKVWWQNEDQLRFILREGKKRQIRRMCEQVGLNVVALKRIRIGNVVLGDLPIGAWRYLGDGERF